MTEEAAASCFLRNAGYAKVSLQGEGKDFVILSAGRARSDHEEDRWFRRSVRRRIRDSSLRSRMTRGASRGSLKRSRGYAKLSCKGESVSRYEARRPFAGSGSALA